MPREPDLTDSDPRRTMWDTLSPIALFVSAPDFITKQNKLAPVAIQMDYTPGTANSFLDHFLETVLITLVFLYVTSTNLGAVKTSHFT